MKSFAQNSTRDAGIDRDFQQKRKEVILLQFTVVVCVRMIKISDVLESSDLKNKVTSSYKKPVMFTILAQYCTQMTFKVSIPHH